MYDIKVIPNKLVPRPSSAENKSRQQIQITQLDVLRIRELKNK